MDIFHSIYVLNDWRQDVFTTMLTSAAGHFNCRGDRISRAFLSTRHYENKQKMLRCLSVKSPESIESSSSNVNSLLSRSPEAKCGIDEEFLREYCTISVDPHDKLIPPRYLAEQNQALPLERRFRKIIGLYHPR